MRAHKGFDSTNPPLAQGGRGTTGPSDFKKISEKIRDKDFFLSCYPPALPGKHVRTKLLILSRYCWQGLCDITAKAAAIVSSAQHPDSMPSSRQAMFMTSDA
jgi:hypothetical protein